MPYKTPSFSADIDASTSDPGRILLLAGTVLGFTGGTSVTNEEYIDGESIESFAPTIASCALGVVAGLPCRVEGEPTTPGDGKDSKDSSTLFFDAEDCLERDCCRFISSSFSGSGM